MTALTSPKREAVLLFLGLLTVVTAGFAFSNGPLSLFAKPPVEAFCPKVSQASLDLDTPSCPTVLNQVAAESRTQWKIDKHPVPESIPLENPDNTDILYEVKVSEGPTSNVLVASGQLIATNGGGQTPTLSSVVINLQKLNGKAVTIASAVAVKDEACRDGQGLDGGQTCFGQYTNSAGANLLLRDVNGNDVTALLGNIPIPPSLDCSGAVVLNFTAEFDLSAVGLEPGEHARIEVLATFVGAGPRGNSPESVSCTVDANCNGLIDSDNPTSCQLNESESDNVRTVKQRMSFQIPPLVPVCPSVIKRDDGAYPLNPACVQASTNTLNDQYSSQGDGTLHTEQISGQASCVNSACSTDIVNVATLECVDGRNELITGSPAIANIHAFCEEDNGGEISAGDFCTATQGCWGQPNQGFCAAVRDNQYSNLVNAFAGNFGLIAPGGVLIGDIYGGLNGALGGFAARWTTGVAVRDYLPNGTPAGTLTVDQNNATNTSSGVLDAQLLAATLNKARDDAGLFQKNRPEPLASLVLKACEQFNIAPSLQGLSVHQLICVANKATSGTAGCSGANSPSCIAMINPPDCGLNSPVSASLSELTEALDAVNNNFDNCKANLGCLGLPELPPEE